MAAGHLPKPGTELGPCLDEACGHIDCAATRAMAAAVCHFCQTPIGYDRGFVHDPDSQETQNIKRLVHFDCLYRFLEP